MPHLAPASPSTTPGRSHASLLRAGRGACLSLALLLGVVHAADRHVGVADCAGSTCHGATRSFSGQAIQQDEYFVWLRRDRHAGAYKTLQGARSQKISARLGWGRAEQAEGCLVCHAHAPPQEQRGPRFLVDDGIGCEACHGPAERWIGPHVRGFKSAAERRDHGMFPTWSAAERAPLCLSCHQGDARHPMTHAIMAAGHPDLLFEVDTFMALMPPHHEPDADYAARKGTQDAAANWMHGQLAAAAGYLQQLAGMPQHGLFPELALFDCDACHHSMKDERARSGAAAPGSVPLADSALAIVAVILEPVDPALAKRWQAALGELRRSVIRGPGPLREQAASMRDKLVPQARDAMAAAAARSAPRELSARLVASVLAGHAADFQNAEQVAMALQVLAAGSAQRGAPASAELRAAIDAVYQAIEDRDRFSPARYRAALLRAQNALR